MNKTQLAAQLTLWGLVVEGDETYDELYTAYKSFKAYLLGGTAPRTTGNSVHYMRGQVERHNSNAVSTNEVPRGWN